MSRYRKKHLLFIVLVAIGFILANSNYQFQFEVVPAGTWETVEHIRGIQDLNFMPAAVGNDYVDAVQVQTHGTTSNAPPNTVGMAGDTDTYSTLTEEAYWEYSYPDKTSYTGGSLPSGWTNSNWGWGSTYTYIYGWEHSSGYFYTNTHDMTSYTGVRVRFQWRTNGFLTVEASDLESISYEGSSIKWFECPSGNQLQYKSQQRDSAWHSTGWYCRWNADGLVGDLDSWEGFDIDNIYLEGKAASLYYRFEAVYRFDSIDYIYYDSKLYFDYHSPASEYIDVYGGITTNPTTLIADHKNDDFNVNIDTTLTGTPYYIKVVDEYRSGDTGGGTLALIRRCYVAIANTAPMNDGAPTCSNLDDTDNLYARLTKYEVTTYHKDVDGFADLDEIWFMVYDAEWGTEQFRGKFMQDTHEFSEEGTTAQKNNWELDLGGSTYSENVDDLDITWKFYIEWECSDFSNLYVRPYIWDEARLLDNDWYGLTWDVVTGLDYGVTPSITSDDAGTVDRGDLNEAFHITGDVHYINSLLIPPSGDVDVWVACIVGDYGTNSGPWEDDILGGSGEIDVTCYADDEVGQETYAVKIVKEGAGYGGTDLEVNFNPTDTYIADQRAITWFVASDYRINIGTTIEIRAKAVYDFDDTEVSTGTITLNGTYSMTWDAGNSWFDYTTSAYSTVGARCFNITDVADVTHGITGWIWGVGSNPSVDNHYLRHNNLTIYQIQEFTIELWYMAEDLSDFDVSGINSGQVGFRNYRGGTDYGGFLIPYRNSGDPDGLLRFYAIYNRTTGGQTSTYKQYYDFEAWQWYHFVYVAHSDGQQELYQDGVLRDSWKPSDFEEWTYINVYGLLLHGWGNEAMSHVDELRFYSRAYTASDAYEAYHGVHSASDLVSHYKLEGNDILEDAAGSQDLYHQGSADKRATGAPVSVVWDSMMISYSLDEAREDLGEGLKVSAYLTYAYDGTNLATGTANFYPSGSVGISDGVADIWPSFTAVRKLDYYVSSVTSDTFGITTIGIWDWDGTTADYLYNSAVSESSVTAFTYTFWLRSSDNTYAGTTLSCSDGTQHNEILLYNYNGFTPHIAGASIASGIDGTDGTWNHWAWQWQSSDGIHKIYKNGILVWTSSAHQQGITLQIENIVIGQEQDSFGGGFDAGQAVDGEMADIRLYLTYLDAHAIHAIYQRHYGFDSSLLIAWDLSDTDVDDAVVDDQSANNLDASIYGITSITKTSNLRAWPIWDALAFDIYIDNDRYDLSTEDVTITCNAIYAYDGFTFSDAGGSTLTFLTFGAATYSGGLWTDSGANSYIALGNYYVSAFTDGVYGLTKITSGFYFAGTDDRLEIPHDSSQTAISDFTIEGWFYPTSSAESKVIVAKAYGASRQFMVWWLSTSQIAFIYKNTTYFTIGCSPTGLALNTWHHFVITIDGSTNLNAWYDGIHYVTDYTMAESLIQRDVVILIGCREYSGGVWDRDFIGYISHLRMYSRALADDECYAHYQRHYESDTDLVFALTGSGLRGNTGTYGQWIDSTANNNDATAYSGTSLRQNAGTDKRIRPIWDTVSWEIWVDAGRVNAGVDTVRVWFDAVYAYDGSAFEGSVTIEGNAMTPSGGAWYYDIPAQSVGQYTWDTIDITDTRFGLNDEHAGLYFDGSNDYATIVDSAALNTNQDYSVSVWFYYSGDGAAGKVYWTIASKNEVGAGYLDSWHFYVAQTTHYLKCRVGGGSSGQEYSLDSGIDVFDSNWHMATLTYDHSERQFKLFLDGYLKETYDAAWDCIDNADVIRLGSWNGYGDYYKGYISEILHWSRTLPDAEIFLLYAGQYNITNLEMRIDGLSFQYKETYEMADRIASHDLNTVGPRIYDLSAVEKALPVWDEIEVYDYGADDGRINTDDSTYVYFRLRLAYDNHELGSSDTVYINSTSWSYNGTHWRGGPFTNDTVVKYVWEVTSASEVTYGITALTSNSAEVIWDAIGVNMWISDGRDDIDDTITVYAWLIYLYDATNVTDGTVLLNGTGMSYGSSIWSLGRSQSTVGLWSYNVASVSGNTHGITVVGWNEFNGADETDYVNAPDSVSLSITGSITVSAWIYIDSYMTDQPAYFILSKGSDGWGSYHFRINNATNLLRFMIGDPASQWGADSVYLTEVLSTGEWHLITGVWDSDADELRIYWNGVLNNTDPTTYASIYDEDVYGLTLGCLKPHYYYFNGSIDSVRIYNRSLSTVEIYELYQCRYSDDTGLVFHVNMASWDVADNTWYDLSGEGNNATIYGPVISVWSTYHPNDDFVYVRPIWDSLTITITGPTDQRNNINANATGIYVSAVYDYDSEPYDGTFTMNNTDYDGDGTVVKWGYTVTSASGDSFGITAISVNDDTYHIWDSLTITITGPTDQRNNINANATGIYVSAVYDYDSEPYDGTFTMNNTDYDGDGTVVKWGYTVTSASGDSFGITAISVNDDTYHIWDAIGVNMWISDGRDNIDDTITVYAWLTYLYDGTNVTDGTVLLNGTGMSYSNQIWSLGRSQSTVGLWSYNVTSISGNTHGITVVGEADFDSTYVELIDDNGFPAGSDSRTITAWVYPRSYPQGLNHIFHYGNDATGQSWGIVIHSTNGFGPHEWGIYQFVGGNVPLNEWVFLVITMDADGVKLHYMDGEYVGTLTYVPNTVLSDTPKVGSRVRLGEYFDGYIGEIQLYSRVLSSVEIFELYQGRYSNDTGLVFRINMASYDVEDEVCHDLSENGNNGTIVNAVASAIDGSLYVRPIWDRLNVDIQADDESPDTGDTVTFTITVTYEYDSSTCLTWTVDVQRDAAASWLSRTYPSTTFTDMESSPTSHDYLANAASETIYLLSIFTTNTETVTWYNQYPVNVSLSVDYDDTDNWYARYRYYLITFTVSDGDGYGNIETVQIALFESTRTTMYWAVNYTQATDTFTEAYGASKIVLAGWTYDSSAGNQIILYIYIKVEWSHGELTDADFRGYVIDDVAESDLDWYDENADIVCTLDYTVTPTVTDAVADGTRGDISGSLTGDGTVIYYGSSDNYPLANETDVWILHDVSGTWSDDVDGSGAFSRAMTAESSVRLSTYSIKVVISGAGSGGTDLYYTTTITDTYISDAIGAYLWINDGRDDIDDTITVYAWLTYLYDATNVTDGTVLLNGTGMSYSSQIWSLGRSQSTVGLWAYNITSISGNTNRITVIGRVYFDGDDKITVTNNDSLNSTSVTVSAWVMQIGADGWSMLFDRYAGGGWGNGERPYLLGVNPDGSVWGSFHTTGGDFYIGGYWSYILNDNIWYHLTMTYDYVNGGKGYVNGALEWSVAAQGELNLTDTLDLSFGTLFNGSMTDIRVYNRTLDAAEVFELYQGRYSNATGLVLFLHGPSMDVADNTWYDLSGEGNDGTITGAIVNTFAGSVYVRPIWDSLTITITGPTDQRNNINANATGIYVSAVYDYDSEPYDGTFTMNNTDYDGDGTVVKWGYTVTSASGDSFGITAISVNDDTYHIWDSLTITITDPTDPEQRIDLNANATGIIVSAVYDYDGEPYDGTLVLNSTTFSYATVQKQGYTVSSATGDDSFGITVISANDETYYIWDSLTITITDPTDPEQRIDLNANATGIIVSAVYDYDGEPYDGTLVLNSTTFSFGTVGKRGYTVTSASGDDSFGITVISTNDDTYCIWDEMLVLYILADEDVTNFGQSVNFTVGLQYKYDSDNVQTGTFSLEALALAFSSGANWTVSDSHGASGSWLYNDVTGTDGAYSLTGIDMDGNSITVVWDIIVISASLNYDWTIIGYNLTITTTGTFEHLGYTWNGTPTWSGTDYPEESTIGNYTYTLNSITEPDYGVTTFTNDPTLWAIFDTVNCSRSALYWKNTLDADWLYLDTAAFFFGFNESGLTENFRIQSYYGYPDASTSSDYAYVNNHSQIDRLIIGNFSGAGMDTINASYSAVCTILGEPEYRIWSYDMSYLDARNVVYEDTVFVDAGARAYILNNEEVRNEIHIVLYNNSMIAGSYAEEGIPIWVRILAYRDAGFPSKTQIWSSTKSLSTNMGGTVVWSLRNWDAWNICNKWNTATSPFIYIHYSTVSSSGPWTFINAFHALGSNYNLDPYNDATWTVDLERSQVLVESDWSPDRENLTAWMEADSLTPYGYGEFAQYEWINVENWNRYVWEALVTIWADFGAPITGPAPLGEFQYVLNRDPIDPQPLFVILMPLTGWQIASGVDDISYFWLDVFPQWAFWYQEDGQWYQTGDYDISLWLRTRLENNILWSPWYQKLADPNNYEYGQHFQENLALPFDYRNTELSIAGERVAISGDITFSFEYTIYENDVNVGTGSVNITPTLNVWSQFAIYWDRQQGTGNVNYSIYCDTTAYEEWTSQSLWINGTYSKAEPPSGFTIEQFEVEYDDVYINIYCQSNWANSTLYLYVDGSLRATSAEADIIQYRKSMTEGTHSLNILIDAGSQTRWRNYTYAIGVDAITLKIIEFEWDTGSPNTYSCFVRTNWGNATVRLLEDGNTRFMQTEVGKGMSFKLSKVQRIGVHTVTLQIDAGGQILTYILGYSYREPDHPSDTPDVGPMLSVIGDELSDSLEDKIVLHPALIGFILSTAFMAVIIIIIVFKWLLKEPIL